MEGEVYASQYLISTNTYEESFMPMKPLLLVENL